MSDSPPTSERIRPRDRDAIVQSLRAGVVPRVGQQHIQVGRANEVTALVTDIDRIAFRPAALGYDAGVIGAALWGQTRAETRGPRAK